MKPISSDLSVNPNQLSNYRKSPTPSGNNSKTPRNKKPDLINPEHPGNPNVPMDPDDTDNPTNPHNPNNPHDPESPINQIREPDPEDPRYELRSDSSNAGRGRGPYQWL